MEVGGIEKGCSRNFLSPYELRRIVKNANDFQFLFGCVCFHLFYTQDGTNMAQDHRPDILVLSASGTIAAVALTIS